MAALVEGVLWMPSAARAAALALVAGIVAAALLAWVAWPGLRWGRLVRPIGDDDVALLVGRRFPEVGDRLINWMQLSDGRHTTSPPSLVRQAADRLERDLVHVPIPLVEDFSGVRRSARWLVPPALVALLFLVAAPEVLSSASSRLLDAGREYTRPAPYAIEVLPGDIELVKGADLTVTATLSGSGIPDRATLETRVEDESVVEEIPVQVDSGRVAHTVVNVRNPIEYRVVTDLVATPWYEVTVIDRPVLGRLQVSLRWPAYTRRPPEALPPDQGDVAGLPGTEVFVESIVSGPDVAEAAIRLDSGSLLPMSVEDRRLAGSFRISGDDGWTIGVRSTGGILNDDPVRYGVTALVDAPPLVSWEYPVSDVDLDETTEVPIGWRIADDFGFRRLVLKYRLAESRFGTATEAWSEFLLPIADPFVQEQADNLVWNVAGDTDLDPVPGDVVAIWLEVADNDDVSGPKTARTTELRLRVPSLAERYESVDENQDGTEEDLEELADEADALKEEFERLQDALRSKPEADWQDRRAVERMEEQQRRMEESVEEVARQIEDATEEMQRNDLVSEETLEMYRELQQVAQEIASPELTEALRQLQQAMEQMDLGQMQESMERFEFNEEQYRERLDRTLELFRNLRVQKDLEEAARRAEDLARTEAELAEKTREAQERPDAGDPPEAPDSSPREQLAREQERAAEDMQRLEEKMSETLERMQDVRQAPRQSMQQLTEETRSEDLPGEMQENAEQLREGKMDPARQGQQNMSQQLKSLMQRLQDMRSGMQGQQMQVNMAGLRRALDDVLSLSKDQEALRAEVQRLAGESPRLRTSAQDQLRLSEGLSVVTDSLRSMARQIPQMGRDIQTHAGESLLEMSNAVSAMTERVPSRAAGHQKGAMTQLNELALLLADVMDQMQSGQSGGSGMSMQQMMQQLQDMAGQQQQLNQQIQQMLNDLAGNRLSQDAAERMQQMADQQRRIREQLRELGQNRELRNTALGDLERMAEQMQETIDELTNTNVSNRTSQRQQQILTRLLEATRSLQERGRERRRESRSGEDARRDSPAALTPNERAERLRRDLIRALENGYAPDYQELIRRYFDLLQRQQGGTE